VIKEFLRGKIPVRELVAKKHGDNGSDWKRQKDDRLTGRRKIEASRTQVAKHQRQPRPQNCELEKHHPPKFGNWSPVWISQLPKPC